MSRWLVGGLACVLLGACASAAPSHHALAKTAAAKPARKHLEVALPASAGVPDALVPTDPKTGKKLPARLALEAKIGALPPVTAVESSPDGKSLLAGTYGRVAVWDLTAGRVSRYLQGIEGAVHDLAFSPDGKRLAVAGGDEARSGTVWLFDGASPDRPIGHLTGDTDVVFSIAWSPDSRRLATASLDKLVKIWDVAAAKEVTTLHDHSDRVFAVAWSPDGKFIVSGGRDKSIKEFDAATGKSIRTFNGNEEDVLALAVSPDSKQVLSAGPQRRLHWWSVESGQDTRQSYGHGSDIFELRYSKDGKSLESVSQDGTLRVWNAGNGGQEKQFNAEGESLLCGARSPDGKLVAAGSWNGWVRVWDVASGRLLAQGSTLPDATPQPEYLLATPEGYVSASPGVQRALRWTIGGAAVPQEPFAKALLHPEEVQKALRGQAVSPVKIEAPEAPKPQAPSTPAKPAAGSPPAKKAGAKS